MAKQAEKSLDAAEEAIEDLEEAKEKEEKLKEEREEKEREAKEEQEEKMKEGVEEEVERLEKDKEKAEDESRKAAEKPSIRESLPQSSTGEKVITYTDTGYSPSTLEIKIGDAVTFKNQSSRPMWTASAAHPTHRIYPTTGGCIGSTFDACKSVEIGDSWSFRFDITGMWKYHDHLNPSYFGTIIVQ